MLAASFPGGRFHLNASRDAERRAYPTGRVITMTSRIQAVSTNHLERRPLTALARTAIRRR
jgi:hypothetical protein